MSEVVISLFKKIVLLLVVCVYFLSFFTSSFNLLKSVFTYVPSFAENYVRLGLSALVFALFKRMVADS